MCSPSMAPKQFGRCHSSENRAAMAFHPSKFGTGIYDSLKASQMALVVSSTILATVHSPLAKYISQVK